MNNTPKTEEFERCVMCGAGEIKLAELITQMNVEIATEKERLKTEKSVS